MRIIEQEDAKSISPENQYSSELGLDDSIARIDAKKVVIITALILFIKNVLNVVFAVMVFCGVYQWLTGEIDYCRCSRLVQAKRKNNT